MSYRYWLTAIAFGLIVLAGSGQAQEETQGGQGQATQQQNPAQTLPLPFPVEIIEDEAATEARQRREEEASQREIDDLAAQQGMAQSTEAMNAATQDMRQYALYSTILVGVGTGLLVVTLLLTWQANRAAVAAVEATREFGHLQSRAYLSVKDGFLDLLPEAEGSTIEVLIHVQNTGVTPANNIRVRLSAATKPGPIELVDFPDIDTIAEIRSGMAGPNIERTFRTRLIGLTADQFSDFEKGLNTLVVIGRFSYDTLGATEKTCLKMYAKWVERRGQWVLIPMQTGNGAT
jgi:hypothetical protein